MKIVTFFLSIKQNIFKDKLSEILKEIDPNDIPEDLQNIVEKNIIVEENIELGKIKFDDKVLHRSKVIKIFTEDDVKPDRVNKDLATVYKKIKILCLSAIKPRKGQLNVIETMKIIKDKKIDFHVFFAGEIQDRFYYRKIIKKVKQNKLEYFCTFKNYVSE